MSATDGMDVDRDTGVDSDDEDVPELVNHKEVGDKHYKAKDYRKAVQSYTNAINASPANPLLYLNRSASYLMLAMYKEAITDCDKAIEIDLDKITTGKAYFRKTTALKGLGKLNEAIECAKMGLECDSTNNTAYKDMEMMVACRNKLPLLKQSVQDEKGCRNALLHIDTIIKDIGTNFRDLNILKAICLMKLKKITEAYNLTNNMMKSISNSDIELIHLRSQLLYIMGDIENSKSHLQSAMRLDPDNSEVRTFYRKVKEIEEKKEAGSTAFKAGLHQDAINLWTECINLDTMNHNVTVKLFNNRATALAKLKKYEDAVADCTKAIAIDAEYTKAYLKRGECNFALGGADRLKQCISDYEKVAQLSSEEEQGGIKKKIQQAKVALKRAGRKDLYALLGVTPSATEDEIKKAYRKCALRLHPDKQASKSEPEKAEAESKFKAVNEAYEILGDPEKKQRYDSGVDVEDMDNPHASAGGGHDHGGMHGGMDPNILFQMFMQQQMGGRGGGFR